MADDLFGLPPDEIRRLRSVLERESTETPLFEHSNYSPSHNLEDLPRYAELQLGKTLAEKMKIDPPYFRLVEPLNNGRVRIDGREVLSFASYDYLGLGKDPRLFRSAEEAMKRWGTSAFASRLVSGERPVHRDLERALADLHGCEAALSFVSGHATNVTVLGSILGGGGVLLHDEKIHNSIIQGAVLAGARRISFAHNDWQEAERALSRMGRSRGIRLVVIEGLYSMDGDLPDLPHFVETAHRHGAWLMVDEAHSIGVLGETGRGIAEVFGLPGNEVDLWMGTLSKALGGCGGYIASSGKFIEYLRYTAPGFVFSVGMPPAMAAVSLTALDIMNREPERVRHLQDLGDFALSRARSLGLKTGFGQGHAILPIVLQSSSLTVSQSSRLLEKGYYVPPAIPPAVEDRGARLRLFLNTVHSKEDISAVLELVADEIRDSAESR